MKKSLFIAALAALALATNASSQKPPTATNPGVTAQFASCAADDANCKFANRVRNDIATPYANGVNGVSAVFFVSGSRDLVIQLNNSTRSALFDFANVTSSGGAPGWALSSPEQLVKPNFNVFGAYYARENCVPTPGDCSKDYVTRMNAGLWQVSGVSNTTYALLWNPTATTRPVNSPQPTVPVNVHYSRTGTNEVFVITPVPNGVGQSIAGLEVTKGRSVTGGGQYNMPFTLTVRLQ